MTLKAPTVAREALQSCERTLDKTDKWLHSPRAENWGPYTDVWEELEDVRKTIRQIKKLMGDQ